MAPFHLAEAGHANNACTKHIKAIAFVLYGPCMSSPQPPSTAFPVPTKEEGHPTPPYKSQ